MSEIIEIPTVSTDGTNGSITAKIIVNPTCRIESCSEVYEARDLFEALSLLRERLEESGILLACNGACLNVFPSGMAREMSHGRKAYILKMGVRPKQDDIIDIFDKSSFLTPATIVDQQTFFEKWKASF